MSARRIGGKRHRGLWHRYGGNRSSVAALECQMLSEGLSENAIRSEDEEGDKSYRDVERVVESAPAGRGFQLADRRERETEPDAPIPRSLRFLPKEAWKESTADANKRVRCRDMVLATPGGFLDWRSDQPGYVRCGSDNRNQHEPGQARTEQSPSMPKACRRTEESDAARRCPPSCPQWKLCENEQQDLCSSYSGDWY